MLLLASVALPINLEETAAEQNRSTEMQCLLGGTSLTIPTVQGILTSPIS
jgi:hypothetical protein